MILVYEYMPSGTLADHLYKLARKNIACHPLSWKQRLQICIGAGRGLDYLHTGHGIIHRDVKPSNVLLDEKFVAKISDFGLAKIESQVSTNLKGTFGYIDPDYFKSHKLSTKSDTYSFGVVLLEVLCGRPAVDHGVEEDRHSLTMWAQDHISKGEVDQIVAPSLRGEISPNSLETFVVVVERCLLDEPKKRPAIAHVVIKLELALEQQENAESLAPRERTSIAVADVHPSSNENNITSLIPNERTNVADDVLAQKENVRFLVPDVADALPCNKSRQEKAKSLSHNVKASVEDLLPGSRTPLSVSTRLSSVLSNLKIIFSLPIKQRTRKMSDVVKKGERKSALYKLSQPLFQREAFWNTRKSSKNKDLVSNSLSAPLACKSSNMTLRGITVSEKRVGCSELILNTNSRIFSSEMKMQVSGLPWQKENNTKSSVPCETTNVADVLPLKENAKSSEPNEITRTTDASLSIDRNILSLNIKLAEVPSNWETFTSPLMNNVGKKYEKESMGKSSDEMGLVRHAGSAPISCGTSNMTLRGSTVSEEIIGRNGLIFTPHLRIFSYSELKSATRNFRNDLVVGEGGFGKVYKGWLKEESSFKNGKGSVVAVKKWTEGSFQGFSEWQSEVEILGRLSHPNLVKLLGHCREDKDLLLVYEFMQKGSLEKHLFGGGSSVQPLPWDIRLRILIGAARGLAFLHASDRQVIYRDLKTSNILLDESYHAKLTDFGLAKLGPAASDTHITTQIMGTHGYAAPEYVATGHLYVKSDVYGFGVVLLEMLTGLRAIDGKRPAKQQSLVDWMKPRLSNMSKLKKVMDLNMGETSYPPKSALKVAQIALKCFEHMPTSRPSMQEVVEALERIGSAGVKPR
ncbi:hypothetical protein ACS0TY_011620 [Phlomoides rotata]